MKKNSFIKCIAVGLAATLALAGCDSGGSDPVIGSSGSGGDGGGVSGTGSSGTGTGMGLTGASSPVTGSSGSSTGGTTTPTTTTPTTTTPTTTTTTTTGTDSPADPVAAFTRAVSLETSVTGIINPTQMVQIGNRVFYLDGFNSGQDNGRLMSFTITSTVTGTTFSTPAPITKIIGSPESESLDNPFGLATDGTDLFISVGYGISTDGAILKVSNLAGNTARFERITLGVTPGSLPLNPTFLFVANVDGQQYCYWSEYSAVGGGGRVRRVRTDAVGGVQEVLNQLNFPAGIATDGTNMVVCDSSGGTGGQVVRVPLSFTGVTPRTPSTGGGVIISATAGEQSIQRPFDVTYDGSTGFVFTEGNAIVTSPTNIGPGPLGVGGAIRYLPKTSTTAKLIANGLNNPSGVSAVSLNSTNVGVTFVESVNLNGTLKRRVFNPAAPTLTAPVQLATGLNQPLSTLIVSESTPEFLVTENYSGGSPTGLVSSYRP